MHLDMRLLKCATVGVMFLAPLAVAERWTVQYFYDEDRTTLVLEDLAFPSAQRGIAVGSIYENGGSAKPKFTALLTSDGGAHWSLEPIKEHPRSVFFLNDSMGWMVTDNAIWFSEESGRGWKKISDQKKPDRKVGATPPGGLILRVWFLDPQHGFAVGLQKTVLETHDGGHTWTPVEEAAKPTANPSFTAYTRIAFDGDKVGMIIGGATPPRPDDVRQMPAWLEPERAVKRRQFPNLTVLLQTVDGGAKWQSSTSPLFGVITSLRVAGPHGLAVMEFNESFEWPSEVHRFDLADGKSTLVFREKDRRVVDGALFAGPRVFLAAVEPPGKLNSVPIPGKVKIFASTNFTDWTEMDVSYKAIARTLVLAGPDAGHLWAATDTGMILQLVP
jgi:hypothetical protein